MREYVTPLVEDVDVRRDFRKVLGGISTEYTNLAARSFPEFENPVFVIWGSNDPMFPAEDGRRIASAFPDSRITEVHGTRAFVPEDKPDTLVRTLREFLAETS